MKLHVFARKSLDKNWTLRSVFMTCRSFVRKVMFLFFICVFLLISSPTLLAAMHVPLDIYFLVQSSPRIDYFFNQQQIYYEVDKDGYIDLQHLIVPVVKRYDKVQIEDVLQKRKWRMQTIDGFLDLAGSAEYLTFDLRENTVTIKEEVLLNETMGELETTYPEKVIFLKSLSERSYECMFYEGILSYVDAHQEEIIARMGKRGKLREEDRVHLATKWAKIKSEKNATNDTEEKQKGLP